MSIFKCKMCGGTLDIQPDMTVAECEYCGTKQTLPRLDDDKKVNLYDRANYFRRNGDFDKAMSIYEKILNEDGGDAEAYWSLVLCRYGIEYVQDPQTQKQIPTVNRAQFTSVFADVDYKSALQYADAHQREVYEAEARAIDEIQKGILDISRKEDPFDVFICYKESDRNGHRTQDSVLANDLYHELTEAGFKVFFSRITLEDKLGSAYEPYIFAALNSAKVMVVLGTKSEYFNAVWVRNEWSRYLTLIKNGAKKVLIPAYKDMDPYNLPEEFSHLQAQDMSQLGFVQDIIRGIKKIVGNDEPNEAVRETVVVREGNTNITPLLKRAFMFLEDGDWESADEYCEKVLDADPENARAYLGKLMAEKQVHKQEELADCADPFADNNHYKKVLRFGDEELVKNLQGYVAHIEERNENMRREGIYSEAISIMDSAETEFEYKKAAKEFESISGYKDADEYFAECMRKAEIAYKEELYVQACDNLNQTKGFNHAGNRAIALLNKAIDAFSSISDWKDSAQKVEECRRRLEEVKAQEEAERLEQQRREEEKRLAAENEVRRKRRTKIIKRVIIVMLLAGIVFAVLVDRYFIPENKYKEAMEAMEAEDYITAHDILIELEDYKDSRAQIDNMYTKWKEQVEEREIRK